MPRLKATLLGELLLAGSILRGRGFWTLSEAYSAI